MAAEAKQDEQPVEEEEVGGLDDEEEILTLKSGTKYKIYII